MIQEQLLKVINSYNSDSYYKHGNIPSGKFQAAVQHFPIDPNDVVLALIDTTLFGSAKTGMAIGLKGIYFKNDWTTKAEKSFLSWDELSNSPSGISYGKAYCISLVPGCEINMSGSSMKKDLLINLLNQIIELYRSLSNSNYQPQEKKAETYNNVNQDICLIEISPNDDLNLYSEFVPEMIAICMAADGEIEDSEVELALGLIESDDFILDKQAALESLSLNIENLVNDRKKSKAIFKLKSTTIISKASKFTNNLQKERLNVILEGMLETVSNDGASETSEIIETIKKKLTSND